MAPNHKQFDGAVVELKPAAVSLPDFGNVDREGYEIAHSGNGVSTVEMDRISQLKLLMFKHINLLWTK